MRLLSAFAVAIVCSVGAWSSVATAATYEVGSGKPYATLAAVPALSPGDVVVMSAGTYHEVKRWTASGTAAQPITIRGVGAARAVIDADGLTVDGAMPNPRAVFQIEASHIVIEHLEFINARNGNNGAGVRITGSAGTGGTITDIVIRDCRLHDCDMGMMSGLCDRVLVESCEVDHNGTASYAGYSHNFYLGGGTTTIRGCWIHDALQGQNVKSRGHYTELLYNLIADSQDGEVGLVDEAATTTPNSNALLVGNVIISKNRGSGWNTGRFVWFGSDLGGAHSGTMYAYHNTCIAGTTSIAFFRSDRPESAIVVSNNLVVGGGTISGSNQGSASGADNWMTTGMSIPAGFTGSVLGAAPGFVDVSARDYHLVSTSPCRDIGMTAPLYVDGDGVSHSALPTREYVALGNLATRTSDGYPDAGAYEATGTVAGSSTTGSSSSGTGTGTSAGSTSGGTTSTPPGSAGGTRKSGCGVGGAAGLAMVSGLVVMGRRRRG